MIASFLQLLHRHPNEIFSLLRFPVFANDPPRFCVSSLSFFLCSVPSRQTNFDDDDENFVFFFFLSFFLCLRSLCNCMWISQRDGEAEPMTSEFGMYDKQFKWLRLLLFLLSKCKANTSVDSNFEITPSDSWSTENKTAKKASAALVSDYCYCFGCDLGRSLINLINIRLLNIVELL